MKTKYWVNLLFVVMIENQAWADTVHVGLDFSFKQGHSTVPREDFKRVKELADLRLKYPNSSLLISGHTDWIASDEINQELSEARAKNIKYILAEMAGGSEAISTRGFGKKSPIAENKTEAGRTKNRRITSSFFDLKSEEIPGVIKKIKESKYLYLISVEHKDVESHIQDLELTKPESIETKESPGAQTPILSSITSQSMPPEQSQDAILPKSEESIAEKEVIDETKNNTKEKLKNDLKGFWTGFYVGLNAGFFFGEAEASNVQQSNLGSGASVFNQDFDIEGLIMGLQAGYNHQFQNNFVLGLEFDYVESNVNGKYDNMLINAFIDSAPSLKLRLGYAMDRKLFYALIGFTAATKVRVVADYSGFDGSGSSKHEGSVLGLGYEYAITKKWSTRIETIYYDFGSESYRIKDKGSLSDATANGSLAGAVLRLGLNYKL